MTIAVLLWPHANARYFSSVEKLSLAELGVMLRSHLPEAKPALTSLKGIPFITFETPSFDPKMHALLSHFSAGYAVFELKNEQLLPLMAGNELPYGQDISGVLKYKGKTNEMFTAMLINLAVFSSDHRTHSDQCLTVVDPMCGRGTTLFEATRRGYSSFGVEIDKTDVDQLRQFIKRYFEFNQIKYKLQTTSLTVNGKQGAVKSAYTFAKNADEYKEAPQQLCVTCGDTLHSGSYAKKPFAHALVSDLPYGIAHESRDGKAKVSLDKMMQKALVEWKRLLLPGAGIALSFNEYTLPLEEARDMVTKSGYEVYTGMEYDGLSHWVEQAISRNVVVARFPGK